MSWHDAVKKQLVDGLNEIAPNEITQLNNSLRLLAKHRSILIQNTLIQNNGLIVQQGPLAGLNFISQSAEGCHVAKLLGCYEQPLHPFIYEAIDRNYDKIINIGCAEGYYAVGMARHLQKTQIHAYDIDIRAQESCLKLAQKNNVEHRIEIGSIFKLDDFAKYEGHNSLVFCDIEGSEVELLNPKAAPALCSMDIIVEVHEVDRPGSVDLLISRFSESHTINLVEDNGQRELREMPDWFMKLAHLDQLLATWEWRSGPTPWLVMSHKLKK